MEDNEIDETSGDLTEEDTQITWWLEIAAGVAPNWDAVREKIQTFTSAQAESIFEQIFNLTPMELGFVPSEDGGGAAVDALEWLNDVVNDLELAWETEPSGFFRCDGKHASILIGSDAFESSSQETELTANLSAADVIAVFEGFGLAEVAGFTPSREIEALMEREMSDD